MKTLSFRDLWINLVEGNDTIHTITVRTRTNRFIAGKLVGVVEGDYRSRGRAAVDIEVTPDREPVRIYTDQIRTIYQGRLP